MISKNHHHHHLLPRWDILSEWMKNLHHQHFPPRHNGWLNNLHFHHNHIPHRQSFQADGRKIFIIIIITFHPGSNVNLCFCWPCLWEHEWIFQLQYQQRLLPCHHKLFYVLDTCDGNPDL